MGKIKHWRKRDQERKKNNFDFWQRDTLSKIVLFSNQFLYTYNMTDLRRSIARHGEQILYNPKAIYRLLRKRAGIKGAICKELLHRDLFNHAKVYQINRGYITDHGFRSIYNDCYYPKWQAQLAINNYFDWPIEARLKYYKIGKWKNKRWGEYSPTKNPKKPYRIDFQDKPLYNPMSWENFSRNWESYDFLRSNQKDNLWKKKEPPKIIREQTFIARSPFIISYQECGCCGHRFLPERAGTLYCSPVCRSRMKYDRALARDLAIGLWAMRRGIIQKIDAETRPLIRQAWSGIEAKWRESNAPTRALFETRQSVPIGDAWTERAFGEGDGAQPSDWIEG